MRAEGKQKLSLSLVLCPVQGLLEEGRKREREGKTSAGVSKREEREGKKNNPAKR
jgi:hypothetical protein